MVAVQVDEPKVRPTGSTWVGGVLTMLVREHQRLELYASARVRVSGGSPDGVTSGSV